VHKPTQALERYVTRGKTPPALDAEQGGAGLEEFLLIDGLTIESWLSGKASLELLKPAAEDALQRWPVSKRVNSSRAPDDDPTLIDKIAAVAK
jgi:hypothetical protein